MLLGTDRLSFNCFGDLSLIERAAMRQVHPICPTSRLFGQVDHFQLVRDSGVVEVITVLTGENGTAAFPGNREIEMVLLALQVFQVLFLWVHDWIPLGRLNDVAAVRSQDTRRRLVTVMLIQSVLWTIGLCFSLLYFRRPYPTGFTTGS
jgi:hypothetical protein